MEINYRKRQVAKKNNKLVTSAVIYNMALVLWMLAVFAICAVSIAGQ